MRRRRGAMGREPKLERVSAGVYRNRRGNLVQRQNRGRRATVNQNASPVTGGQESVSMVGDGQMTQPQMQNPAQEMPQQSMQSLFDRMYKPFQPEQIQNTMLMLSPEEIEQIKQKPALNSGNYPNNFIPYPMPQFRPQMGQNIFDRMYRPQSMPQQVQTMAQQMPQQPMPQQGPPMTQAMPQQPMPQTWNPYNMPRRG